MEKIIILTWFMGGAVFGVFFVGVCCLVDEIRWKLEKERKEKNKNER